MIGKRRFMLTLAGICSFTAIMIVSGGAINPFNLGLGIAFMLFPQAISKFAESRLKGSEEVK